jgi:hypothetical protein
MPGDGNERDAIGERGEDIFKAEIGPFHGRLPLFRARHLGDKWPLLDFVVELIGPWKKRRPFFFVQVKATRRGYTKAPDERLKVGLPRTKVFPLAGYRVPVYLVGVDVKEERAFVISARGKSVTSLTNMHTAFELTKATRRALWNEVRKHWASMPAPKKSAFIEPRWW